MNSLSDAREFDDPQSGIISGATHVPSKPSTIPRPRTMPCRDSGLPHDTRNIVGTSGNVFERSLALEGLYSTVFNNSKNLASSSQALRADILGNTKRPESEMRRESQHSSIPVPCFQSGGGMLNHTGGTYAHSGMMDHPIFPISEFHLGKFPLWNFQAGKSTSRMRYVQEQRIFRSPCTVSKKFRLQSQLTNL